MPECPHCEELRDRIEVLQREVGVKTDIPAFLRMTPREEIMLSLLLSRDICRRSTVMNVQYGHMRNPPEERIMDVTVCTIRKKLKPYGIEVHTVWGRGWRIMPEDKRKIEELSDEPGRSAPLGAPAWQA